MRKIEHDDAWEESCVFIVGDYHNRSMVMQITMLFVAVVLMRFVVLAKN